MDVLKKTWDFITKSKAEPKEGVLPNIGAAVTSIVKGTLVNAYDRTKELGFGIANIIGRTAKGVWDVLSWNPITMASRALKTPLHITRATLDKAEGLVDGVGRTASQLAENAVLDPIDYITVGTKNLAKKVTLSNLAQNSENKFAKAYGKSMGAIIDVAGPTHIPSNAAHWALDSIKRGADKS